MADFVETMDQKADLTKLCRTTKGNDSGERSNYHQWNIVLMVKAANQQVAETVQHFKAGKIHFLKRNPISNKEDKEETIRDVTDIHGEPSNESN